MIALIATVSVFLIGMLPRGNTGRALGRRDPYTCPRILPVHARTCLCTFLRTGTSLRTCLRI